MTLIYFGMEKYYFKKGHYDFLTVSTANRKGCALWAYPMERNKSESKDYYFLGYYHEDGTFERSQYLSNYPWIISRFAEFLSQKIKLEKPRKIILSVYEMKNGNERKIEIRKRPGPKPDLGMVRKVHDLRKLKDEKGNPLSIRDIATLLKKDIKSVHRWAKTKMP